MTRLQLLLITLFFLLSSLSPAADANAALPDSAVVVSTYVTDASRDFMNVLVIPEKELIVIQLKNLNTQDLVITLLDDQDNELKKTFLYKASTIAFFETETLYAGNYVIKIADGVNSVKKK